MKRRQEMVWEAPTQEETVAALGKVSGAAGTDGWTGEEVRNLPKKVKLCFHKINRRWEQAGKSPAVMKDIRQVNLCKPGKSKDGKLNAEHTRPISVASVWWRAWATTWVMWIGVCTSYAHDFAICNPAK